MQNQYSIRFKEASRTGSKCLWLKAVKKCDCYDEDRLIDSEPDPKCPKCYGLGKIRQAILTDKMKLIVVMLANLKKQNLQRLLMKIENSMLINYIKI